VAKEKLQSRLQRDKISYEQYACPIEIRNYFGYKPPLIKNHAMKWLMVFDLLCSPGKSNIIFSVSSVSLW
jgi:hypothetical protein